MRRITDKAVLKYLAECAESSVEDDFNEDEEWTNEEHAELKRRAFEWISKARKGVAIL